MLRYEVKKVFSKFKNRMAVALLFLLLIVVSFLTISRVWYVDENGDETSGILAAKNLREDKNKWSGYLTKQVLLEVFEENAAISHSKEALSEDIDEQDKAYAKTQGISDIVTMINNAFSAWRDYNAYAIEGLSPQEVTKVYEKRVANLNEWLASGEERFSDAQKDFLTAQYENLETPFYYEYLDGWSALLQSISTFLLILALIIGFLVSGIFSDEFLTKADSIFFSTKLGRNMAIISKMKAGFLIVTGFYLVFVILYTLIVLLVLGWDGAGCPIQLDMWRSVYNVTLFQAYLLIVAGGYVGTLFSALLGMLVSAASHSTATAAIMPFIVLCFFPFLSRIITLPGICSFFPDQLLDIYNSIKEFDLVEMGGRVMEIVEVIIPVYLVVCVVLQPLLYRVYQRAEIK